MARVLAVDWFGWLKSTWTTIGIVGSLAFAGGVVVAAIRKERLTPGIPSWWWIGNGLSLVVVSQGIEDWLQGVSGVAGLLSTGIGLPLFVTDIKEGRIRFRKPETPNRWELQAATDWQAGGRLVRVLHVTPHFHGLREESPFVEFAIEIVSMNLHSVIVSPEVRGRIGVPDAKDTRRELHVPPELHQVQQHRGTTTETRPVTGPVQLKRNEPVVLWLRQHVLPAVRESLRTKAGAMVSFNFQQVIVSLSFVAWESDQFRTDPDDMARQHLPLREYHLEIPEGI